MAPHRELLQEVSRVFDQAGRLLDTANEDTIRDAVINKILALVNPHYLVNQTLKTGGRPDYVFFDDRESKERKDLDRAIAVGDAKEPGTDFDRSPPGGRSAVRQVYDYMADAETQWGILTDGRRWRILNLRSPSDRYLEVDLADVVTRDDSDEWLYFFNLFRREAFLEVRGQCFLDSVREESTKYAQKLGDSLKDRAYSALLELAKGFFAWPENGLDPSDEQARETVRQACFVLLYRLLFVFYAEARDLLPRWRDRYSQLSLESLREEVRGASRDGGRFLSGSRRLWVWLRDLFRLIDAGDPDMGIPPFNGGLFARDHGALEHANFLERNDIADAHLARAVDYLGTTESLEERHRFVSVDYSGLEIRHLGSIYEGLLEYRVGFAETDLVSVKRSGAEVWTSREEYRGKTPIERLPLERVVASGDLYLETDKHERKVTGSYYTPGSVVKYIVSRSLEPIVNERKAEAREREDRQSDAVLSIRVCDPAMGSGHFLVEATEFLAEELLRAVEDDHVQGLLEPSERYDLEWAKREIVRHCIYGVDANELAVELAKVSLWLITITENKPLSFLDHRLKHGNSLIGTRLSDLKEYPDRPQRHKKGDRDSTLPGFISEIFLDNLIGKIRELEEVADDDLEDIKRKERVFSEFKSLPEYEKTKAIANVHTSVFFGNEVAATRRKDPKQVYFDLIYALDYPNNWAPRASTSWFQQAQGLAEDKRFFHWELEFPEVFFPKGVESLDGGFDAVVGNPPYVRIYRGQIPEEETAYFTSTYASAHMKFDLYVLFMELGLRLLREGGMFSMILPDKWMNSPYGEPIRTQILRLRLAELADLRGEPVFKEVSVDNVIPVVENRPASQDHQVRVFKARLGPSDTLVIEASAARNIRTFQQLPQMQIRPEISDEDIQLAKRIKAVSIDLASICYVNWGLRTGTAEKTRTMISERKDGSRYRQLIRGEDIEDRYTLRHPSRYIDYDTSRLYNPMFPELFESPKLVFRKISGSRGIMAALDTSGAYAFSTVILAVRHVHLEGVDRTGVVPPTQESIEYDKLGYLLAIVNSRLVRWFYETLYSDKLSVVPNHVKKLPIRAVRFQTEKDRRSDLLSEAREMYSEYLQDLDPRPWHEFVSEQLDRDHDQADVLVDVLDFLATELTESHDARILAAERFLEWIQSPAGLGLSLEDLRNKTRILEFHLDPQLGSEDAQKSLEEVLKENNIRLNPESLRMLRQEYEIASNSINELRQHISSVDIVVDLLVYRLFGLSPREIALIQDCDIDSIRKQYQWPA